MKLRFAHRTGADEPHQCPHSSRLRQLNGQSIAGWAKRLRLARHLVAPVGFAAASPSGRAFSIHGELKTASSDASSDKALP